MQTGICRYAIGTSTDCYKKKQIERAEEVAVAILLVTESRVNKGKWRLSFLFSNAGEPNLSASIESGRDIGLGITALGIDISMHTPSARMELRSGLHAIEDSVEA